MAYPVVERVIVARPCQTHMFVKWQLALIRPTHGLNRVQARINLCFFWCRRLLVEFLFRTSRVQAPTTVLVSLFDWSRRTTTSMMWQQRWRIDTGRLLGHFFSLLFFLFFIFFLFLFFPRYPVTHYLRPVVTSRISKQQKASVLWD